MSENQVLVSVVTVAYNSEKTIRKTIESVLNQTYPHVEYWIIDGASKDGTVAIAKEYEDQFDGKGYAYHILSEPDAGIYDAMNKGCKKATGQIVGIINSDDWYEPNAVERMIDTYRKRHFDMFYADLRIVREDGNGGFTEMMIKHSRLRAPAVSRDWNHPTTFITRKVYDRYQYKLESLHDDWDLVLKIRRGGYRIVVLNEVLANFRYGGVSNERSLKKSFERGRARYRIYRNNGYSRLYFFECVAVEAVKFLTG